MSTPSKPGAGATILGLVFGLALTVGMVYGYAYVAGKGWKKAGN